MPAVSEAIQRFEGSGEASGEAHIAAVTALRFTAWPPKGAANIVKTPVVAISGPGAGLYWYAESTARPGRFCDAIVTMKSGTARLTTASIEKCGVVQTSDGVIAAQSSTPDCPLNPITSPATIAAAGVA